MAGIIGLLLALVAVLQSLLFGGHTASDQVVPISSEVDAVIAASTTTRAYYEPLYPMQFGNLSVMASLARTPAEHERGLSGTSQLPPDIIKVFMFATSGRWGFWMPDMRYPIDIIWLDEEGSVVYLVTPATPESYPDTTFVPEVPARYVLETVPGLAASQGIATGTKITVPTIP